MLRLVVPQIHKRFYNRKKLSGFNSYEIYFALDLYLEEEVMKKHDLYALLDNEGNTLKENVPLYIIVLNELDIR